MSKIYLGKYILIYLSRFCRTADILFENNYTINNIRKYVVGIDKKVLLRNGKRVNYINFDNAASTPALLTVANKVNEFLEWYSSIHRGNGTSL